MLLPLRFAQARCEGYIITKVGESATPGMKKKKIVSLELHQPLFITGLKHSFLILMLPRISKHSCKQIYYILKGKKS